MDLLIRNARLRGRGPARFDLAIEAGRIAAIGQDLPVEAAQVLDAEGSLVTESFVNPHLHLDKVYTLARLDEAAMQAYHGGDMGQAMTAIELASRVKAEYDREWLLPNIRRALRQAALHGCTHIRAFADVDTKARLEGVEALLQARQEFAGVVVVQVVAFPQDGVVREPGAADLVRQALERGADVVGGIPWIEYTEAHAQAHIDAMFDLAVEFDRPVSMLVDDAGDPGLRTLEKMVIKTLEVGWHGRALAHHARAMALYPRPYLDKLAALMRQANLALVTDPHTGPLHARVRELLDQGVTLCLGQDDISDAYYPFGRNNMLEVAFLAAHLLWMTTRQEMETLYDMVTTQAARAMGLKDFGLREGGPAHLVVLGQPDVLEALRYHQPPRHVVSHGRLVDPDALPGAQEA